MREEEARLNEAIDKRNLQQDFERRRYRTPALKPLSNVLSQLLVKKGYAYVQTQGNLEEGWKQCCGHWNEHSRCGKVKRGILEVFVRDSLVLQELTFHKIQLLQMLVAKCPDQKIKDLKFRVAALG